MNHVTNYRYDAFNFKYIYVDVYLSERQVVNYNKIQLSDRNGWQMYVSFITSRDLVKLVFMVSIKSDLALLSLVDLGPYYVSADDTSGELECAAMFDVHYADNYNEFEDFSH